MSRRRLEVVAVLAACVATALFGFRGLSGPLRSLEQDAVVGLLGGRRVTVVAGHTFQVLPVSRAPFRAALTPFCSSLVPVLALAAIALFILRGPAGRRVVGLLLSAGLIFACNVLRISGSVWVGLHLGSPALVLFHDWVGTLFALAYTMTGFFLLLFFLLPSATARIPRAARVSDVL